MTAGIGRARAVAALGVLSLLSFWSLPATVASAALVPVSGVVYLDVNEDGVYQAGTDQPLAGVNVSNGEITVPTAADGSYVLLVNQVNSRHAWVSVPRGYLPTTPFYFRVPLFALPQTVNFGMREEPSLLEGPFTFAQLTDPELTTAQDGVNLAADLAEIAAASPAPAFVVVTGDLIVDGGHRERFGYYKDAFDGFPLAAHHAYGNHDADAGSAVRTLAYEDSLGPTYYSFNHCGAHFVVLNSMDPPLAQAAWLSADVLAMPPGSPLIILRHSPPARVEMAQYKLLGADAILSGHWHGDRVRTFEGMLDVITPPVSFAGIDHSPRGFQLVTVDGEAVTAELRLGGVARHVAWVHPPQGGTIAKSVTSLLVNAYDSRAPVASVQATLTGPTGPLPEFVFTHQGAWSWSAPWDSGTAKAGLYTLSLTVTDVEGGTWSTSGFFTLVEGRIPAVLPGAAWDQAGGGPSRDGVCTDVVVPPLTLSWAAPLGGVPGTAAPVVHGAKVFASTSRLTSFEECGVTAVDALTGERLWRRQTSTSVRNAVAASEDAIFAVTLTGQVLALDPDTGSLLWSRTLGDSAARFETSSPTLDDATVYAGRAAYRAAFTAPSGSTVWSLPPLGPDFVPNDFPLAATDETRIYQGAQDGLDVLRRTDGGTVWSLTGNHRGGALRDGVFYGVGGSFADHYLYARSAASGSLIWSAPQNLQNGLSTPALSDSLAVVGSAEGTVWAFSRQSGAARWSFATGTGLVPTRPYSRTAGDVLASPVISGDAVYFGATDGRLYALDLASGAIRWQVRIGAPIRGAVAVSGNALYVAADDGVLYAFVSSTTPTGVEVGAAGEAQAGGLATSRVSIRAPNPLRPAGQILLAAPPGRTVRLDLLDVRGRLVRSLFQGVVATEAARITWDGRGDDGSPLAPGVYLAVARSTAGEVAREKLLLLK